jgi:rhamnulokinase
MKNFLAFDIGASSGRGIIGTIENEKIELREIHRFPNGAKDSDGSLFWDFKALVSEIHTGLQKALDQVEKIDGIGIDTWGVDYLILKKDGNFARPPYHYRDSRTDGMPEKVFKQIGEEELYSATGIQAMKFNTIFQLAAHQEKHPEDLENGTMLLMPDAIVYELSGKVGVEFTNASTTGLLNAEGCGWNYDILDRLGINKNVLPDLKSPCSVAGTLKQELQDKFNCEPVPIYYIGSHDTASAVAAVPASGDDDWAYISCGTWALLGSELKLPITGESARKAAFTNERGLEESYRFLTNIMGSWLFQESRRHWNSNGKNYSFMEMEAAASQSEALKFFINPNDESFFAPGNMPQNIVDFCQTTGQGRPESDAEILRCIYDSLAFCFKNKLELLKELSGKNFKQLHIVGGGCKDSLLMQLTADAIGLPVLAGPVEATAIGNIIAQGIANGEISDLSEGRRVILNSMNLKLYKPDCSRNNILREGYKRYLKLIN